MEFACVQTDCEMGNISRNVERACELAEEAARRGADLISFPELCTTGCFEESRAREMTKPLKHWSVQAFRDTASEKNAFIQFGFAEKDPSGCYNSSVLVDPSGGIAAVYRKIHLYKWEKGIFAPGSQPVHVERVSHMLRYLLPRTDATTYSLGLRFGAAPGSMAY